MSEHSYRKGWLDAIDEVLRGLRSEDDSTQLRAIVAEVEAMRETAAERLNLTSMFPS